MITPFMNNPEKIPESVRETRSINRTFKGSIFIAIDGALMLEGVGLAAAVCI